MHSANSACLILHALYHPRLPLLQALKSASFLLVRIGRESQSSKATGGQRIGSFGIGLVRSPEKV